MQMKFYFGNIWNYEHETKWTRLWCKNIFQISVKQTKGNGGLYFCLHSFGELAQKSFHGSLHMPIIQATFLKTFLKYKWITTKV